VNGGDFHDGSFYTAKTSQETRQVQARFSAVSSCEWVLAKKVRGKLVYFGKVAHDPKGKVALNLWLDQNFKTGWIDFPRPKTAVECRCPLCPETIATLKEVYKNRPTPKDDANSHLVFITKYGLPWYKERKDNLIAKEFRKLLDSIDVEALTAARRRRTKPPAKIYRRCCFPEWPDV
jgi:hypothetical protein